MRREVEMQGVSEIERQKSSCSDVFCALTVCACLKAIVMVCAHARLSQYISVFFLTQGVL